MSCENARFAAPVVVVTGSIDILSSWILTRLDTFGKYKVRCTVTSYSDMRSHLLKKKHPHFNFWQCCSGKPDGWNDCLKGATYAIHNIDGCTSNEDIAEREKHFIEAAIENKIKRVIFICEGFHYQDWTKEQIDDHVFSGSEQANLVKSLSNKFKNTKTEFAVLSTGVCFGELKFSEDVGGGSSLIRSLTEQILALPMKNSCTHVQDASELAIKMLTEANANEHILIGEALWVREISGVIYDVGMQNSSGTLKSATLELPNWSIYLYKTFYDHDIVSTENYLGANFSIDCSRAESILNRKLKDVRKAIRSMTLQMINLGCLLETVPPSNSEKFQLLEKKVPARDILCILGRSTLLTLQDKSFAHWYSSDKQCCSHLSLRTLLSIILISFIFIFIGSGFNEADNTNPTWLRNEFQKFDYDDSKYIDICEFRTRMNSYHINNEMLRLAFIMHNEDFQPVQWTWRSLSCADVFSIDFDFMISEFEAFDVNADEQLSLTEFQAYFTSLKNSFHKEAIEEAFHKKPATIV